MRCKCDQLAIRPQDMRLATYSITANAREDQIARDDSIRRVLSMMHYDQPRTVFVDNACMRTSGVMNSAG